MKVLVEERWTEKRDRVLKIYRTPDMPVDWEDIKTTTVFLDLSGHSFGDGSLGYDPKKFSGWLGILEAIRKIESPAVIEQVWIYDHSGIRFKSQKLLPEKRQSESNISTNPFSGSLPQGHASWDSAPIGFLFVRESDAMKEYGWTKLTDDRRETIRSYMHSELDSLNQSYLGDIYSVIDLSVKKCNCCGKDTSVENGGCSGFLGWPPETNGINTYWNIAEFPIIVNPTK